jgi:hypothetical protein
LPNFHTLDATGSPQTIVEEILSAPALDRRSE